MIPVVRCNEPERLLIQIRPSVGLWLIYVGFGLLFVLAGLVCLYFLGTASQLKIDAREICYEQKRLIGPSANWSIPRKEFVSARLIEESNAIGRIYRVALFDHTSKTSFLAKFSDMGGDEKRALLAEIESVIGTENGTLWRTSDTRLAGALLGAVCIGGGIWCLLAIQVGVIRASRTTRLVQLHRRRLLLPGSGDSRNFGLDEIRGIRRSKSRATTHSGIEVVSYQVSLVGKGNKQIPVALDAIFTEKRSRLLLETIESWLDGKDFGS